MEKRIRGKTIRAWPVPQGGILLVNSSNHMSKQKNASAVAAGSTPGGAFPRLPISLDEAHSQRNLFGSFGLLFPLETYKKSKQTPP